MKLAVMSVEPMLGKSTLCTMLASTFAISQAQYSCIISTGPLKNLIDGITLEFDNRDVADSYMQHAVLQNSESKENSVLDMAIRQGKDNVFIYECFDDQRDEEDAEEFAKLCLAKVPAELILCEIDSSTKPLINTEVIDECDARLFLFDISASSIKKTQEYYESLSDSDKLRTFFCVAKYDQKVTSLKSIQSKLGKNFPNKLFFIPYSPAVAKLSYEGELDKAGYNIVTGMPEFQEFRLRMYDIMSACFDSPERKIIRTVDKWYK